MLLIGLLLVAFGCLGLGLVLASAAWLIGSLVASAVAALVLWLSRDRIRARGAGGRHVHPVHTTELDETYLARRAEWFAAGTAPGEVWVIDGRPHYHRPGCRELADAPGEPIRHEQATEDGFTPCPICSPDAPPATAAAEAAPAPDQVWVVDGRPRYHRPDCLIIEGQSAEAIPRAQAGEDGFLPCSLCTPDTVPG